MFVLFIQPVKVSSIHLSIHLSFLPSIHPSIHYFDWFLLVPVSFLTRGDFTIEWNRKKFGSQDRHLSTSFVSSPLLLQLPKKHTHKERFFSSSLKSFSIFPAQDKIIDVKMTDGTPHWWAKLGHKWKDLKAKRNEGRNPTIEETRPRIWQSRIASMLRSSFMLTSSLSSSFAEMQTDKEEQEEEEGKMTKLSQSYFRFLELPRELRDEVCHHLRRRPVKSFELTT